jgi:hypothetical protein
MKIPCLRPPHFQVREGGVAKFKTLGPTFGGGVRRQNSKKSGTFCFFCSKRKTPKFVILMGGMICAHIPMPLVPHTKEIPVFPFAIAIIHPNCCN